MVTQIDTYDQVDVFVGLDVGKGEHHAVASTGPARSTATRCRMTIDDSAPCLPSFRSKALFCWALTSSPQFGALPVAVAQAAGALVGYLPGLAMRRIADLHPGEAKTDARDAAIIAETARTMPHTLRSWDVPVRVRRAPRP